MKQENFIADLDELHQNKLKESEYKGANKEFSVYVPVKVNIYGIQNENFLIKKSEFTKYLYTRSGCRVYFSDADIISMLLQMKDKTVIHYLIARLIKAYQGEFEPYQIFVGQKEYEVCGICQVTNEQILENEKDIAIPFDDILILLNLIISKDYAASRLPQWRKKPNFLKQTLIKYIALLKFYYDSDMAAQKYLTDMGYDIGKGVLENYANTQLRDEKNNFFCNFNVFEESGMI